MRVITPVPRARHPALCALVLLAACVSASAERPRQFDASYADRNVLTDAQITSSRGTTAYETIERLRPMFLLSRVDLGGVETRLVYLNGVALGGLDELRAIPASSLREIRFVRSIDLPAFGTGQFNAVIFLTSKSGR